MRMSDWSSDVCSSDLLMLVFSVSPILAPLAGSVIIAIAAYRTLLTDTAFLVLSFIGAFGISSFFAYLAHSSFVLIEHYGMTDRKSVLLGKSVSVRVHTGGSLFI